MDDFVVRLRIERRRGAVRQLVGAALVASVVPFVWLVGANLAWILSAPLAGGMSVGGIVLFARGTQTVHRATMRLSAAKQIRQLPAARVVS